MSGLSQLPDLFNVSGDLQKSSLLVADVDRPGGIIDAVLEIFLGDLLGVLQIIYAAYVFVFRLVPHPYKPLLMNVLISYFRSPFRTEGGS